MDWYSNPQPFRLRQLQRALPAEPLTSMAMIAEAPLANFTESVIEVMKKKAPHSSHPDFAHLCLLVFEAVLEVVVVAAPGYILARQGVFTAESQAFLSTINISVFTPCLIFSKLAAQLKAEKLADLAIIPAIFVIQTIVSWGCAQLISRCFGFKKRARNFVIAMGVFGNSNSLPISLVISLSKTLSGLHWDKIPGDNDNEVAARGILYLLIFQQLGQMLRWSWGYNVLLAPAKKEPSAPGSYLDQESEDEEERLVDYESDEDDLEGIRANGGAVGPMTTKSTVSNSGTLTPGNSSTDEPIRGAALGTDASPNGTLGPHLVPKHNSANGNGSLNRHYGEPSDSDDEEDLHEPQGIRKKIAQRTSKAWRAAKRSTSKTSHKAFNALPQPMKKGLGAAYRFLATVFTKIYSFMNPPLWAMLAALIVASVPVLQHLFYDPGTFINNYVSHAIGQSGGVAVPLILFVLGGNLARNTLPKKDEDTIDVEDPKEERNVLIASILSRMLFPTILMAPVIALFAKYVPISILDDPIFVIVAFLLTGAPSALQLSQICQVNKVFMGAMSKLLFQSYVVWILPSTLILVMLALETVEWAAPQEL